MVFDVAQYLDRIGRGGGPAAAPATPATLAALTRAHVQAIPFENLDPVSGRAPSLDLDDLAAKLVTGGRGGYCYEHNTLFNAVLRELGFDVTLHVARVTVGAREGAIRPCSHMLLLVRFDGEPAPYLADVGFGSIGGLLEPIRLVPDTELDDGPRRHRLVRIPADPLAQWLLQARSGDTWANQYTFTEERFQPPDYQMFNWYVATYPRSPFRLALHVQRTFSDRHLALAGTMLTTTSTTTSSTTSSATSGTTKETVRELADHAEVVAVLRAEFGIEVPDYFASAA